MLCLRAKRNDTFSFNKSFKKCFLILKKKPKELLSSWINCSSRVFCHDFRINKVVEDLKVRESSETPSLLLPVTVRLYQRYSYLWGEVSHTHASPSVTRLSCAGLETSAGRPPLFMFLSGKSPPPGRRARNLQALVRSKPQHVSWTKRENNVTILIMTSLPYCRVLL